MPKRLPIVLLICVLSISSVASGQGLLAITGARIETASEAGTIDDGVILIRDGNIEAVGADVEVPASASVIRANGRTVMPGFVDPYYVVNVASSSTAAAPRVIVFNGQTFIIGASPASVDRSFVKMVDAFSPARWDWAPAVRSGITSTNLTSRGYGQSCLARPRIDADEVTLESKSPRIFMAITNDPASLRVLRSGLKAPKDEKSSGDDDKKDSDKEDDESKSDDKSSADEKSDDDDSGSKSTEASKSEESKDPWAAVRSGKQTLVVNANNAAAVLYVVAELKKKENKDVQVAMVVSGSDAMLTLDQIPEKQVTLILAPRLDSEPNTRRIVNVARLADERKIPVAFSLSSNQTNYRQSQDVPLFAVAQLVRSGLDRDVALKALTATPAKVLGLEESVGSIQSGRRADLLIFDGDPMGTVSRLDRVLVGGETTYRREL